MEHNGEYIDTKKIMQDIKAKVAAENLPEPDFAELEKNMSNAGFYNREVGLGELYTKAFISSNIEINDTNPIIIFIKRLSRKLTFWIISLIVNRQSVFNYALLDYIRGQDKKIDELSARIAALEEDKES